MASVFSKILSGEIPCHKVAETNDYLAFLDIQPLAPGHTLVIPKKEVDYIFDMDDESLMGLIFFQSMLHRLLKRLCLVLKLGSV